MLIVLVHSLLFLSFMISVAKVTIKTSGKKTLESIKKTLKSLTDKTITVTTKQVTEKSDSKSSKKGKSKLRGSAYSGGSLNRQCRVQKHPAPAIAGRR